MLPTLTEDVGVCRYGEGPDNDALLGDRISWGANGWSGGTDGLPEYGPPGEG